MLRILGRENPLPINLRSDPGSYRQGNLFRRAHRVGAVCLAGLDYQLRVLNGDEMHAATIFGGGS